MAAVVRVVDGMPPESREWIIPAPLRILLWWPLIAFVVAVLQPSAAAGVIAAAGAGLGLLGAAVKSALACRIDNPGGAVGAATLNRTRPAGDTVSAVARHGQAA